MENKMTSQEISPSTEDNLSDDIVTLDVLEGLEDFCNGKIIKYDHKNKVLMVGMSAFGGNGTMKINGINIMDAALRQYLKRKM